MIYGLMTYSTAKAVAVLAVFEHATVDLLCQLMCF